MADTDNFRQSSNEELEINQSETGTFTLFFLFHDLFLALLLCLASNQQKSDYQFYFLQQCIRNYFSFRSDSTRLRISPTGSLMFRWPQKTQELEKQENESTNETVSKQRNRFICNRIGPLVLCSA